MKLKNIHSMLLFFVFFVFCQSLLAHSGQSNVYGCHQNNVSGGYHCHGNKTADRKLIKSPQRKQFHALLAKRRIGKAVDYAQLNLEQLNGYDYALIAGFYYDGLGVFTNRKKAYKYAEMAASANNQVGQYLLARLYESDFSKASREQLALDYYQKSADQGYPDAFFALGRLHEKGTGVAVDYSEALRLYGQAANADNTQAQIAMADLYMEGKGVEKNSTIAVKYYRAAAMSGDTIGQQIMGELFEKGLGVASVDLVRAFAWYSIAAEHGNREARKLARSIKPKLSDEDLVAAQKRQDILENKML
jgi:TPR repeat protein